jgi:hypothetical protein
MKLGKWVRLGLAIVICQFLLINYCSAENWKLEIPTILKIICYVDTDSIQANQKEHEIKFVMKQVQPTGYWSLLHVLYNYQARNYTILQFKDYDNQNKLLKSTINDKKSCEFVENNPRMEAVVNEVLSFKGMEREIKKNPNPSKINRTLR